MKGLIQIRNKLWFYVESIYLINQKYTNTVKAISATAIINATLRPSAGLLSFRKRLLPMNFSLQLRHSTIFGAFRRVERFIRNKYP